MGANGENDPMQLNAYMHLSKSEHRRLSDYAAAHGATKSQILLRLLNDCEELSAHIPSPPPERPDTQLSSRRSSAWEELRILPRDRSA